MKKAPKVLIGAPTYKGKDYALRDFAFSLKSIVYDNADILYVDNTVNGDISEIMNECGINTIKLSNPHKLVSKRMSQSNNVIRKKVLDEGYEYYLSLETDMIVPETIIYELLATRKKLIGCLYNIYGGALRTKCAFLADASITGRFTYATAPLLDSQPLNRPAHRVEQCGLGCTLIHRSILEKIEFRSSMSTTPDSHFFRDCIANDIQPYLYTDAVCFHMNKGDWMDKINN